MAVEDVGDLETLRDVEEYIRIASTPVHFSLSLFFLSTPVGYPSRCHSFTTPLSIKSTVTSGRLCRLNILLT